MATTPTPQWLRDYLDDEAGTSDQAAQALDYRASLILNAFKAKVIQILPAAIRITEAGYDVTATKDIRPWLRLDIGVGSVRVFGSPNNTRFSLEDSSVWRPIATLMEALARHTQNLLAQGCGSYRSTP